jgi:hypothetical protein
MPAEMFFFDFFFAGFLTDEGPPAVAPSPAEAPAEPEAEPAEPEAGLAAAAGFAAAGGLTGGVFDILFSAFGGYLYKLYGTGSTAGSGYDFAAVGRGPPRDRTPLRGPLRVRALVCVR